MQILSRHGRLDCRHHFGHKRFLYRASASNDGHSFLVKSEDILSELNAEDIKRQAFVPQGGLY